jgi:pSer/pThr/pTyr-binding forkhead associated (FHA) protein
LPDVSRRHCRFVNHNGGWQVYDLDSLNGVFVNSQRVSQSDLRDGDMLGIGGFQFLVLMSQAASGSGESSKTQAILPPVLEHLPKRRAS